MIKYKKYKYSFIAILVMLFVIGCLFFYNSNNQKSEFSMNVKDITELEFVDDNRYAIIYDTQSFKTYCVQVGGNGFIGDFYLLGNDVFNFSCQDEELHIIGKDTTFIFDNHLIKTVKEENLVIGYGLVQISYNPSEETMQFISYKSDAGCHIPVVQYNSFIMIDMIEYK